MINNFFKTKKLLNDIINMLNVKHSYNIPTDV